MPKPRKNPNPALRRRIDKRYGNIRFQGFGSRERESQVTTHDIRKRQFPKRSKAAVNRRFAVPTARFSYLPHVSPRRHLGSPTALGDDVIILMDFKPSAALKTYINDWFGNTAQKQKGRRRKTTDNVLRVKRDLRRVARVFFRVIEADMRLKIREIVPKMTGRLRKGMVASLTRSINRLNNMPYLLTISTTDAIGTPIFYANPVNNMPKSWLAHPPNTPLFRKHKGKIYELNDPFAESEWYDKVVEYGRDRAKRKQGMLRLEVIRLYGVTQLSDIIYQELLRSIKFK